ncbi:MAG: response regulator [Bacteroidales bacterium]|nr:response regulator [Bacteroidales bacterium]
MNEKQKYHFNGQLVLVVEDNPISYKLINAMLSRVNLDLIHASDGTSAIRYCQERPDIVMVLMDVQLPVMSGIEATREISRFRPDLPIIATTAFTLPEDRDACMEAGCREYITKPIDFDKLYKLIESILDGSG